MLGFKHPFSGDPTIAEDRDNGAFTIMSYDVPSGQTTLGSVDPLALKYVYGNTDLKGRWNKKFMAVEHNGSKKGEWLLGWDKNDIIRGNGGNDKIRAHEGRDRIFDGPGRDSVEAGPGNDFVKAGPGADRFDGGAGRDVLSYADTGKGIGLNLATKKGWGGAKGDRVTKFEVIEGSQHDDQITGNRKNNTFKGGKGADVLKGEAGKDTLLGGDGNDRLDGGSYNDRLFGEKGNDTLDGGTGNDLLNGGPGRDVLTGDKGSDTFVFAPGSATDIVTDFQDDLDKLDLRAFKFGQVAGALGKAKQVGDDVVFTFAGGDQLIVRDMLKADLADDILI